MRIPFESQTKVKQEAISPKDVLQSLDYCGDTGDFHWKKTGKPAGTIKSGYLRICLNGRNFMAHRLAWLISSGNWPKGVIDHINRCRMDNRIANLRDVSPTKNAQNKVRKGAIK